MNAFKRFVARRGMINKLFSDNGTNFVKTEQNEYEKRSMAMAKLNVEWNFIPPASPNSGGIWEARVKSVKTHLKKCIGETALTYEELAILLAQKCAMSNDARDNEILTPGHFLIGAPLLAPPEQKCIESKVNRLTRYQLIQKMHQSFWKKWSTEYLHKLKTRTKWQNTVTTPEVGQLVLLWEENLPPARWASGKIIKT